MLWPMLVTNAGVIKTSKVQRIYIYTYITRAAGVVYIVDHL